MTTRPVRRAPRRLRGLLLPRSLPFAFMTAFVTTILTAIAALGGWALVGALSLAVLSAFAVMTDATIAAFALRMRDVSFAIALFLLPHDDSSPLFATTEAVQPLLLIAVLAALFHRLVNPAPQGPPARQVWVLLAFFGWCLLTIWLSNGQTNQYTLLATYMLLAAVMVVSTADARPALVVPLFAAFAAACLFAVATQIRDPNYAGINQLTGGTHPNILAFEATVVVVLAGFLFSNLEHRSEAPSRFSNYLASAMLLSAAILGLIVIYQAVSRTALVALAAAILVAVLRMGSASLSLAAVAVVAAASSWLILFPPQALGEYIARGDPASLNTLTGRTEIWTRVFEAWARHPFAGYGYGGILRPENSGGEVLSAIPGVHAHNAFLQVLYETGLVGLALFMIPTTMLLAESVRRYVRRPSSGAAWTLAAAILVLLNSMGNGGIALPNPQWAVFIVLLGSLAPRGAVPQIAFSPSNRPAVFQVNPQQPAMTSQ
jgi:O-antigen ligase